MAKVPVYYFTRYDINTDKDIRSSRPATRRAIAQIDQAVILEETVQEVEESELDDNGFYSQRN